MLEEESRKHGQKTEARGSYGICLLSMSLAWSSHNEGVARNVFWKLRQVNGWLWLCVRNRDIHLQTNKGMYWRETVTCICREADKWVTNRDMWWRETVTTCICREADKWVTNRGMQWRETVTCICREAGKWVALCEKQRHVFAEKYVRLFHCNAKSFLLLMWKIASWVGTMAANGYASRRVCCASLESSMLVTKKPSCPLQVFAFTERPSLQVSSHRSSSAMSLMSPKLWRKYSFAYMLISESWCRMWSLRCKSQLSVGLLTRWNHR
jgi:hypothetical protein